MCAIKNPTASTRNLSTTFTEHVSELELGYIGVTEKLNVMVSLNVLPHVQIEANRALLN